MRQVRFAANRDSGFPFRASECHRPDAARFPGIRPYLRMRWPGDGGTLGRMKVCQHLAAAALIALAGISSPRCAEPVVFHFDLSTAKDLPPELRSVREGPNREACLRVDVPSQGAAGAYLATLPLDLKALRGKARQPPDRARVVRQWFLKNPRRVHASQDRCARIWRTSSPSVGLTRWWSNPASSERCRSPSWPHPETAISRIFGSFFRIVRATS